MNSLTFEDFPTFFRELWEQHEPFPWQNDLARRLAAGDWPKYIAAPTGSGKTAALDACVFALAVQAELSPIERTAGRRIFFVVNRRVIVDEAYERAGQLCQKLINARGDSVVGRVAERLRSVAGPDSAVPLVRTQLRGGIYRDHSWAQSLLQPMIVCSTVDQAGSRLLFRGYGVSEQARPLHAALLAQDSVLIVDEAHISRPFIQTLDWVARYRNYAPPGSDTVRLPFQVMQMTATLPAGVNDGEQIALTAADHEHPVLKPRLLKDKPARLVVEEKAKGKNREAAMATRLAAEASKILREQKPKSIAVMVNRVATACMVHTALKKEYGTQATLLIGRLRPHDREAITARIQQRLKTNAQNDDGSGPEIVVSTQCLEVGADLDFDALVTEAASIDSLRQRFGRLNRAGREITPHAVVVLPADQNIASEKLDDASPCDPIYGNAIPRTWHWLTSIALDNWVDFGINAMTGQLRELRTAKGDEALETMLSPTSDAPVLLPAYLDCWAQTNPTPAADPDVALFLHGPQRDLAEVQVCWRADLPEELDVDRWTEILSLCPPSSAECLPVPLHVFRKWISAPKEFTDTSSDAGETPDPSASEQAAHVPALIWAGAQNSREARLAGEINPGDTIVLRAQEGGWDSLGVLPDAVSDPVEQLRTIDVAESATAETRRRAVLRIHPNLWPHTPEGTAASELLALARESEADWRPSQVRDLLIRLTTEPAAGWDFKESEARIAKHLIREDSPLMVEFYPDHLGFVISTRVPLPAKGVQAFESSIADTNSLLEFHKPLELSEHTRDVEQRVLAALSLLPLAPWGEPLKLAAEMHDWGKADYRFQALLRSSSVFAAMASTKVLAKSGFIHSSAAARRSARARAELPDGFRHEMLSALIATSTEAKSLLPKDDCLRALTLHLITSHHGYGRPFAPVVKDEAPSAAVLQWKETNLVVTSADRIKNPAHAVDSGIADRFWKLTRRHGWWGLAFLEAVLRLADQQASASPNQTPTDER